MAQHQSTILTDDPYDVVPVSNVREDDVSGLGNDAAKSPTVWSYQELKAAYLEKIEGSLPPHTAFFAAGLQCTVFERFYPLLRQSSHYFLSIHTY